MATDSKLQNLVLFLKSVIPPAQIGQLIDLLKEGVAAPATLDPEAGPIVKKPVTQSSLPANFDEVLKEMSEAYSETKFPPPSPDESRRVRDSFPDLIERLNAFQGRHLVKMLRDKLKV